MIKEKIIIISGPTASGKTAYSLKIAKENNGVIINADSMQIYSGLPILSAQPTKEEQGNIEHKLFSYLKPTENCNVGLWLNLAKEKIDYCLKNNKVPIVVGGTGMYISKLIDGMSQIPEIPKETREKITKLYDEIGYNEFYKKALSIDKNYTEKLNPNDKHRLIRLLEIFEATGKSITYFQNKGNILLYPKDMFYHININPSRDVLYQRCRLRFENMVKNENVLEEIKNFAKNNPEIINNPDKYLVTKTIGLTEGIEYLYGKISLEEFMDKSIKITRNYAKRQYTWFNHQFDNFAERIN